MGCPRRRWLVLVVGVALALVAVACGDGDDGEAFTTTTAGPEGTVGEAATTAAWGVAVEAGAGALVEGSRVLLREDFQDGDTAGWVVETGWYVLENGERRMAAAGGEAWAWYPGGVGWSRYGVRLAFMVSEGSLGVSVAVGEGGRYVVQFSEEGVHLLRDAPFGSIQALGSAQPVSLGVPHVLAVGLDGGHLQVYVDGVLLIDATDRSPLPGGSVGLGAGEGSSVVVDNIVVASLGGPLPQVQAVAEPADELLPDQLADAAPQAGEQLESEEPADTGFPNLVLTAISVPAAVSPGEAFDVSMTLANTGEADAGAFTVLFVTEWEEACGEELVGLSAGEEITVSCEITSLSEEGSFLWNAAPDWRGMIDEGGREDDNGVSGTIIISQVGGGSDGDGEGGTQAALPNVVFSWRGIRPPAPDADDVIAIDFGIAQNNLDWTGILPDLEFRAFREDGSIACGATVAAGETTGTCDIPPLGAVGGYPLQLVIDADGVLTETDEEDNVTSLVIAVELPNLSPMLFGIDGGAPTAGEDFQVTAEVRCSGCPEQLRAHTNLIMLDGMVMCSFDTEEPGGELTCPIAGLPPGTHRLDLVLDVNDGVAESNENDNTGVNQFTIQQ